MDNTVDIWKYDFNDVTLLKFDLIILHLNYTYKLIIVTKNYLLICEQISQLWLDLKIWTKIY